MVERMIRDARVLWRAESIVADIRLRHLVARSGLMAGAGLVGMFGLLMLNGAGFFLLESRLGPAGAALAVGLADFVIAGALGLVALRVKPGREMDLALEIRRSALEGIERDAQAIQGELLGLREEIRDLRRTAVGLIKHPFDAALPGLVVPLAGMILKGLRKSDESPKEG